jgi:hypothetical protein
LNRDNLVFQRQIQYTVFVAVPSIRLCRGGAITFAQGVDVPPSPPAAAFIYAGEIPAVSHVNSDGEELQVISFQKEKGPDFRPKQRRKPGREKQTSPSR